MEDTHCKGYGSVVSSNFWLRYSGDDTDHIISIDPEFRNVKEVPMMGIWDFEKIEFALFRDIRTEFSIVPGCHPTWRG